MKFKIKLILLFLLILIFNSAQSHVYRIETWSNGEKNLYLLLDFHTPLKEENKIAHIQQDEFIAIVKKCGGSIIVEDVNSLTGMIQPIPIDKRNFLAYLANRSIAANIPVINVEFRHPSINPWVKYPKCGAGKIQLDKADKVKQEILAYDDGPILNNYYQSTLNELKEKIEKPSENLFKKLREEETKTCKDLMPELVQLYNKENEYAAYIVHKAFELYATGAFSMELVCKKINEDYGLNWSINYINMMDNIYMDKLKGRITASEYDKFYTKFREQLDEVSIKLEQLHETDEQYYLTCKHLLYVASKAHDLFVGSEVDEKRQLIKLILQNLKIDGENIVWELHKPFDLLLKCSEDIEWRPQGESNSHYRRERAVS